MKRQLSLSLIIALLLPMLFMLGSCSVSATNDDRPVVVTTIFPPFDFCREIAGDRVDLSVLVTVTDSHSFSPTAADLALIEECDLFVYTGGDGDLWAEDFLQKIDTSDKIIINMMEVCTLLESEHDHHHEHSHHHDHEPESYDEHVWLDPHNASLIVEAIRNALIQIDPDGSKVYQQKATDYLERLSILDDKYHATIEEAQYHTIIVADRFPYRYLCEAYGISYLSAIDGCGSASDLTAIRYDQLIDKLKSENLSAVLCTEYSDQSIAQIIKRESKMDEIQTLRLHSCHTLSKASIDEGITYLSLMEQNLEVLTQALN